MGLGLWNLDFEEEDLKTKKEKLKKVG